MYITCLRRQKPNIECTTSVMMTLAIFSHESTCLANCRPLHISIHCYLIFMQSVQEASVCAYS